MVTRTHAGSATIMCVPKRMVLSDECPSRPVVTRARVTRAHTQASSLKSENDAMEQRLHMLTASMDGVCPWISS
jgi:hypothetical protein